MTPNSDFSGMPLFDIDYAGNGTSTDSPPPEDCSKKLQKLCKFYRKIVLNLTKIAPKW